MLLLSEFPLESVIEASQKKTDHAPNRRWKDRGYVHLIFTVRWVETDRIAKTILHSAC